VRTSLKQTPPVEGTMVEPAGDRRDPPSPQRTAEQGSSDICRTGSATPPGAPGEARAAPPRNRRPWRSSLALAALGVVYGDIGTSPIYTINVVFSRHGGMAASEVNVLGVLSLIFWALLLVVTIKYLAFVLKASNEGDGGVIALATLISRSMGRGRRRWLLAGVVASALLIADGMLTPAISVLSAVQGLELISPRLADLVPELTAGILVLLFAVQKRRSAPFSVPSCCCGSSASPSWGCTGSFGYPPLSGP
jgi:hypothetical protein